MKAKDSLTAASLAAELAVQKAKDDAVIAQVALDGAIAEDYAADQEAVRLQAVVRAEEGRANADPLAAFMSQLNSAVGALATSDDNKNLFITMLQALTLVQVPLDTATPTPMDVDGVQGNGVSHPDAMTASNSSQVWVSVPNKASTLFPP